jgi:glycosyltransferase involved in cell wall biosynthesis
MRIAIDARELAGQPTGVGRFLGEILREWVRIPETAAHEFIYCAPSELPDFAERTRLPRGELAIEPGGGTSWEQRTLPRLAAAARADVLFCPAYSGPMFGRVPLVLAIHDVSFAAHPEWFRWREGLRRRVVTRRAARRAARVITISEFSRREIIEHLGVPASKIDVVSPGVSRLAPQHGRRASAEAPPLILYAGSIFNRRHLPETIRAFARLARRHPDARFTIVGDNRTFPHVDLQALIDDTAQRDRIVMRSYVEDSELADLYGRARAFVFLSEYEGFGLTPLEALASGVPIVVLDTPVAKEVYGPAAYYVASPDPRLIEPALEAVLFHDSARSAILDAAPAAIARYSWPACARGVLDVIVRAATAARSL